MNDVYISNMKDFLLKKQWEIIENNNPKYVCFRAPNSLGFKELYTLNIANDSFQKGFEEYNYRITKLIANLYDKDYSELNSLFSENNTILSIRIFDDGVKDGKILFGRFEIIVEKLKQILLKTAGFEIKKEILMDSLPSESEKYLNLCKFISTEKGSFIANIELPNNQLIYEEPLFPEKNVRASQINNKLVKVLDLVINDIFPFGQFNDSYIYDRKDLINFNILKEIEDLYIESDIRNLSFEFKSLKGDDMIQSNNIDLGKINNLKMFISKVKDLILKEYEVDFVGYIQELKSRDPESDRNTIKVIGMINNMSAIVSVSLPSKLYKIALDVHKQKKRIEIKGLIKDELTQKKMIRVDKFIPF